MRVRRWLGILAGIVTALAAGCSKEPPPAAPTPPRPAPAALDSFRVRTEEAGRRLLSDVDGPDCSRQVGLLAAYARDPNREVSNRAAEFLIQYVRTALKNGSSTSFWEATDALGEHGHADLPALLREVVQAPVERWARGMALWKLARLEGEECLSLLRTSLQDPLLRAAAAQEIGRVAEESGDPNLIADLVATGEASRDATDLGCIAFALRSVRGDKVRPTLAPWIDRLQGWDRTEAAWFVRDVHPLKALERLVELRILPRLPERAFAHDSIADIVQAAFNETVGRVLVNASTLYEPVQYDRIVEHFRTVRPDFFLPQDARQEKTPEGYVVQYAHRGRPYRFTARDRGAWYDLPPVLESVNRALAEDDIPQRFVGLRGYLHVAVFVVAVPDAIERASQELHLPLEPDADAARARWMRDQERAAQRPSK